MVDTVPLMVPVVIGIALLLQSCSPTECQGKDPPVLPDWQPSWGDSAPGKTVIDPSGASCKVWKENTNVCSTWTTTTWSCKDGFSFTVCKCRRHKSPGQGIPEDICLEWGCHGLHAAQYECGVTDEKYCEAMQVNMGEFDYNVTMSGKAPDPKYKGTWELGSTEWWSIPSPATADWPPEHGVREREPLNWGGTCFHGVETLEYDKANTADMKFRTGCEWYTKVMSKVTICECKDSENCDTWECRREPQGIFSALFRTNKSIADHVVYKNMKWSCDERASEGEFKERCLAWEGKLAGKLMARCECFENLNATRDKCEYWLCDEHRVIPSA